MIRAGRAAGQRRQGEIEVYADLQHAPGGQAVDSQTVIISHRHTVGRDPPLAQCGRKTMAVEILDNIAHHWAYQLRLATPCWVCYCTSLNVSTRIVLRPHCAGGEGGSSHLCMEAPRLEARL